MRFYLAVTFWGEEYRQHFLEFCLASLLAPGNLPTIAGKTDARLLIATTNEDWGELESQPTFVAARQLIAIEHVPFRAESLSNSDSKMHEKMRLMSVAHQSLARKMFQDRAQGIFLYPDTVAATGLVAKLEELWRQGASAVMFMNVRFANEGLINEIKDRGLIRRGEPLSFSSKELVRLTLRYTHSEMKRGGFENSYPDNDCSSYFWVVRRGEDLLFHCGGWIPLLIDYGSLQTHDDSALECSTIDGMQYVGSNFGGRRDICFVRNTNDLFMISFTPESSVHYSLALEPLYRIPALRQARKIIAAHKFLYAYNPRWFWKEQFRLPVRFCGGDPPEWKWREVERRAFDVVQRMESGGSLADKSLLAVMRVVRGFHQFPFRLVHVIRISWVNRATVARRAMQIWRGDRVALKRVIWRLRHDICQVFGRTLRDPPPSAENSMR
jgi:hypothetical protein